MCIEGRGSAGMAQLRAAGAVARRVHCRLARKDCQSGAIPTLHHPSLMEPVGCAKTVIFVSVPGNPQYSRVR